jgi:hypothetical protein
MIRVGQYSALAAINVQIGLRERGLAYENLVTQHKAFFVDFAAKDFHQNRLSNIHLFQASVRVLGNLAKNTGQAQSIGYKLRQNTVYSSGVNHCFHILSPDLYGLLEAFPNHGLVHWICKSNFYSNFPHLNTSCVTPDNCELYYMTSAKAFLVFMNQ